MKKIISLVLVIFFIILSAITSFATPLSNEDYLKSFSALSDNDQQSKVTAGDQKTLVQESDNKEVSMSRQTHMKVFNP
jgi:hypothetical protein